MFKIVVNFADGELDSSVTLNYVSSFSYRLSSNLFVYRYHHESDYRHYRLDDVFSIEIYDFDTNNHYSMKGDPHES